MKPSSRVEAGYGIVAGLGLYPALLADRLLSKGHRVAVAGMRGQLTATLPPGCTAVAHFPLGALGAMAAFFHRHGARRIFFAGGVKRRGAIRGN